MLAPKLSFIRTQPDGNTDSAGLERNAVGRILTSALIDPTYQSGGPKKNLGLRFSPFSSGFLAKLKYLLWRIVSAPALPRLP